jgi:phage shock protein A
VTYNFDPDTWYANQRAALERQRDAGELDDESLARALAALDARYEELVSRLDAEFVVPREPAGR